MELINWSGYDWLKQERWGQVHPEKPTWWYDPEQVSIDNDGFLHLKTKKKEKYFEDKQIKSEIASGLVSCTTEFGYGTFEIVAKLPKGMNLWPAFWMYSWHSWPPEIDVLEGYSDKNSDYSYTNNFFVKLFKKSNKYNIQTNVHYRFNSTNKSLFDDEVANGVELNFDPTKQFAKYTCEWNPNIIRISYNDKIVREVYNKRILDKLKGHKMNVIINNGITSFYDLNSDVVSDFVIKSFSFR